jgi:hypothetical protein
MAPASRATGGTVLNHVRSVFVKLIVLSMLVFTMGATGCDGKCSGTYNCPAVDPHYMLSTTNLPSALVEVSADSPCTATLVTGDGGAASVMVVDGAFNETLTCYLHGRLADGETVAATINFQAATISCCPGFVASGGVFSLTDAGADGP